MPIYEYVCVNCGQELEAIQKFSDEPIKECPECKQLSLEKKTSVSAFHLKGGGWYKDGYENSKSSPASKPAISPASDSSDSSSVVKKGATKDKASKPSKTETKTKSAPSSKAS